MNLNNAIEYLSDPENRAKLDEYKRGVALDLLRKGQRYGFSPKQADYLIALAKLADRGAVNERPRVDINGAKLIAWFDAAASKLKWPKVWLELSDGSPLKLHRAGDRSRTPGALHVTDGGPFGDNVWYGRVDRDGTLTEGRAMTDEVREVLKRLADDPAGVAAAHGHKTGSCCFCNRELSDERSTSVGYGPICAGKFGLPWGGVGTEKDDYLHGIDENWYEREVKARVDPDARKAREKELRREVQRTHPDKGGDAESFRRAKEALDAFRAYH